MKANSHLRILEQGKEAAEAQVMALEEDLGGRTKEEKLLVSLQVSHTGEIRCHRGEFVEVQSCLEELEKERHLLSEVVSAMCGRFGAPSLAGSKLLVSCLKGLTCRF